MPAALHWPLLVLLGLFLLSSPARADEARDWLQRMAAASQQQSFQGTFIYERSGHFTTHHIWHQVTPQGVHERMLRTNGPAHEWLRQDGQLVCANAPDLVGGSIAAVDRSSEQSGLLHNWYVLQVLGQTRVAARPVTVISLQPRDGFRYAWELFLDRETGLLLQSLLINEQGALLERFQFTSLDYSALDAADLQPGSRCVPLLESVNLEPTPAAPLRAGWLPPGFNLAYARVGQDRDNRLLTQVFTDGMTRFSLFIEPLTETGQADDLRAQLGPTVAVSRTLQVGPSAYLATVVGELPAAAAERIASALEPVQP